MTDFVFFVRTSSTAGGDFTANVDTGATRAAPSLNVLEAGIRGTDFSTGGPHTVTIRCSVGSGSAADTSSVAFLVANWSNPPASLTIITNDGVSATYDTANYRIESGTGYVGQLRMTLDTDVTIDGLQVTVTGGNTAKAMELKTPSGTTTTAINNILTESGGTNVDGMLFGVVGAIYQIANNIAFDFSRDGFDKNTYMGSGSVAFYNNTSDGNTSAGIDFASGGGATIQIFNNISTNNGTDYTVASVDSSDDNISSDATSPDTAHRNITVTYAGTGDFQTSDSDVVGQGTDLSADSLFAFSTDRLGVSRGSSWDIGAFQDVAAPGGGVVWSLAHKGGLAGPSGLAGPGGGLAG